MKEGGVERYSSGEGRGGGATVAWSIGEIWITDEPTSSHIFSVRIFFQFKIYTNTDTLEVYSSKKTDSGEEKHYIIDL